MIGELAGAAVRDHDGGLGRIVHWQLPEVTLGWDDEGQILPREEKLTGSDDRLQSQVEVLTLDAGWVPLGHFCREDGVPVSPVSGHSVAAQLRGLIAEAEALPEAKAHYPFKKKKKIGPGPRSGENAQARHWDCDCSNYKCTCKGLGDYRGRTRTVEIEKSYKTAYNKEYKAWLKKKKKG